MDNYQFTRTAEQPEYAEHRAEVKRQILNKVFVKLFAALLLSSAASVFFAYSGITIKVLSSFPPLFAIITIVQLVVVIGFTATLPKANASLTRVLYYSYALLTGFTLSIYFYIYELSSILYCFGATALVFGVMALWGYRTKTDLTPIGTVGRMLLIGALVVTLVNIVIFFIAPGTARAIDLILSYVILAIFIGLTAYDMQRISKYAEASGVYDLEENKDSVDLIASQGALQLYLDFINILIRILRIFGSRRN